MVAVEAAVDQGGYGLQLPPGLLRLGLARSDFVLAGRLRSGVCKQSFRLITRDPVACNYINNAFAQSNMTWSNKRKGYLFLLTGQAVSYSDIEDVNHSPLPGQQQTAFTASPIADPHPIPIHEVADPHPIPTHEVQVPATPVLDSDKALQFTQAALALSPTAAPLRDYFHLQAQNVKTSPFPRPPVRLLVLLTLFHVVIRLCTEVQVIQWFTGKDYYNLCCWAKRQLLH